MKLVFDQLSKDNIMPLFIEKTANLFNHLHIMSVISVVLYMVCLTLVTLIPLLVSIAFFTLAERKIMASIQRRKGPNVVGF